MHAEDAYRRFFPLVRHHCQRLVGDLAQDTFLKLLKATISGGETGTVRWLYRTSSNLAIDQLRRRRRTRVEALPPEPGTEQGEALVQLRHLMQRLAERVPAEALQAALLTHANGLTQDELATLLDVTDRTVRRWLTSVDEAEQTLQAETHP
jgi:RNA polymerase sigma-70 factor (ECF subfamily)